MTTTKKALPLIVVLGVETRIKTQMLVELCNLQNTSSLTTPPPVSDPIIKTQAGVLQSTYTKFKGVPPTATSTQVTTARNICITSYNQNAAFIQSAARAAAIAAGDVSVGETLVLTCGFRLKNPKSPTIRGFKVTPTGAGEVSITTKAVAKRANYIRQYGITPTKGVPPTTLAENCDSLEINIRISNLKSGNIYGFREASIVGTRRTNITGTASTLVTKIATKTVATKAHVVNFIDGTEHYNFCDWIYVGII